MPASACPLCNGSVSLDPAMAGSRVRCPHCAGEFRVPASPEPPTPPTVAEEGPLDFLLDPAERRPRQGTSTDTVFEAPTGGRSNKRAMKRCPRCGGRDVKGLRIVWGTGSSTEQSTTQMVGGAFGSANLVGGGVSATSGSAASNLANLCAPPAKQSLAGPGCAVAVGLLFAAAGISAVFDGKADGAAGCLVLGLLPLIAGAVLFRQRYDYNTHQYNLAKSKWDRSFVCLHCGTVFDPGI